MKKEQAKELFEKVLEKGKFDDLRVVTLVVEPTKELKNAIAKKGTEETLKLLKKYDLPNRQFYDIINTIFINSNSNDEVVEIMIITGKFILESLNFDPESFNISVEDAVDYSEYYESLEDMKGTLFLNILQEELTPEQKTFLVKEMASTLDKIEKNLTVSVKGYIIEPTHPDNYYYNNVDYEINQAIGKRI